MLHYYYVKAVHRTLSILILLLFPIVSFSQNASTPDSLLTLKRELIESNQSTKDVDLQLYQMGALPFGVVHMLTENTFTFTTYQQANEQREERLNSRLKATYSYLSLIDFNEDFSIATIVCNTPVTASMINDLITHFGYEGHEIR